MFLRIMNINENKSILFCKINKFGVTENRAKDKTKILNITETSKRN
jgi:hypothetical protein